MGDYTSLLDLGIPPVYRVLGRAEITIFRRCECYTTYFYVSRDADFESDIKNFELEKNDRMGHLKF